MNIYKLHYTNKEEAIIDLIAKGVYIDSIEDGLLFGDGIKAVVDIGLLISDHATFDYDNNELTPIIYLEGYHFDVMSSKMITFENSIEVNNPKHKFFGVK